MTDPSSTDRAANALRSIIRNEDPNRTFFGLYEYVVQTLAPLGAVPTDTTLGLPGISDLTAIPSILGEQVEWAIGMKCCVQFINGKPTRPAITHGDPGTPPPLAKLAGGSAPIARVGDTVRISQAQLAAATITSATGGLVTISTPFLEATIATGSTKVQSG